MIDSAAGVVKDEILCSLVLSVARDARRQALDWIAEGHDPPRIDLPDLSIFQSGLPHLMPSFLEPAERPRQLSHFFGLFGKDPQPFAFESIRSLRELLAYVDSKPSLAERLIPSFGLEEPIFDTEELRHNGMVAMCAIIALSIMDRADAFNVADDESRLRSIYSERETAILADELPIEIVAPLCCTRFSPSEPLRVASNIRIEPLDDLTHLARWPRWPSSMETVPSAVLSAASHAIVIDGIRIPNRIPANRIMGSLSPVDTRPIDRTIMALRVLTEVKVGYAQILIRPIGWADRWEHNLPPLSSYGIYREYPGVFDDFGWLNAQGVDDEALERLPAVYGALQNSPAPVSLAARRLSQTHVRSDSDDITIDSCIGLEALLSKDTTELTHRLGLRAATLLATRTRGAWDAQSTYELVKSVYKHRSEIVHGANRRKQDRIRFGDQEFETSTLAAMLLREVLISVLENPQHATPEALDKALLNKLTPPGATK